MRTFNTKQRVALSGKQSAARACNVERRRIVTFYDFFLDLDANFCASVPTLIRGA
jgi:hypothetical protein